MYMIYQRYTTAIKKAYAGKPSLDSDLASARASREWLESLDIDIELRNALVEPIRVLEEAFQDLCRKQ